MREERLYQRQYTHFLGTTWTYEIQNLDNNELPIPLSNSSVEWGMSSSNSMVLYFNTTPNVVISNTAIGLAKVKVFPTDQATANVRPGVYSFETRITNGTEKYLYEKGTIHVRNSIFNQFTG